MRISFGITFRSSEMITFEQMSTAIEDRPMPKAFEAVVVTASTGHMPMTSTKIGFSRIRPL